MNERVENVIAITVFFLIVLGIIVFATKGFGLFESEPDPLESKVHAELLAHGNPVLGKDDAPITIIEFSDFQCSYCKQFHEQTFPKIKELYIDTGKVRWAFANLPLRTMHPLAFDAAIAGECAHEQNKFFEFEDLAFANAQNLQKENILQFSSAINGLDLTRFDTCVEDQIYSSKIENEIQTAANIHIRSTPTFVIDKQIIVGAKSFDTFKEFIDEELKLLEE